MNVISKHAAYTRLLNWGQEVKITAALVSARTALTKGGTARQRTAWTSTVASATEALLRHMNVLALEAMFRRLESEGWEDVYAESVEAILDGIAGWKPKSEIPLVIWCEFQMMKRIEKWEASSLGMNASIEAGKQSARLHAILNRMIEENGSTPSVEALVAEFNAPEKGYENRRPLSVERAWTLLNLKRDIGLDSPIGEDGTATVGDMIPDREDSADTSAVRTVMAIMAASKTLKQHALLLEDQMAGVEVDAVALLAAQAVFIDIYKDVVS